MDTHSGPAVMAENSAPSVTPEAAAAPAPADVTAVEDSTAICSCESVGETATASATATATPTLTVATSAEEEMGLLRDWESQRSSAAAVATTPTTHATATVLIGNDGEQLATRAFPVARAVGAFMGAVAGHIHDHIHDHLLQQQQQATAMTASAATSATNDSGTDFMEPRQRASSSTQSLPHIECLSIRSEGGMPSRFHNNNDNSHVTAARAMSSMGDLPLVNNFDSVRTVPAAMPNSLSMDRGEINNQNIYNDSMEDQNAEYVLIDGDLVMLPGYVPNEHEREGLEEYQRDQDYIMRPSCQPKPVRKGVRGLRKWIKKKVVNRHKKEKDKLQQHQQQHHLPIANSISTANSATNTSSLRRPDESLVTNSSYSPNASQCESMDPQQTAMLNEALPPGSPASHAVQNNKKSSRNKSPMRGWSMKSKKSNSDYYLNHVSKKEDKKKRKSWRRQELKRSIKDEIHSSVRTAQQDYNESSPTRQSNRDAKLPSTGVPAAAEQQQQQQPDIRFEEPSLNDLRAQEHIQDPNQNYNHNDYAMSLQQQDPQQQQLRPQHQPYGYDALSAVSPPPPALPPMSGPPSHQHSVHASFVGNVDQVPEDCCMLEGSLRAEAYIENTAYYAAYYDDKKDEPAYSVLNPDVDYKVDKADAPDVDYMLQRAAQESATDVLESSWGENDDDDYQDNLDPLAHPSAYPFPSRTIASPGGTKSVGMSCPLSTAKVTDELVHNDVLKVVMVGAPNADKASLGRAIRQSNKKPKRRTTLGVDVHSWAPDMGSQEPVKFSIWDVQGASREDGSANFGADPGIQSLFFSSNSLYLLVWDLAADNKKTYGRDLLLNQLDQEDDDDDDDEDDEEENEFLFEEAKRQADLALQADIEKRVLSWVECIARRGSGSSILPVAVIPEDMDTVEATRRCELMQDMLEHHIDRYQGDHSAPKLLIGMDHIMCVRLALNEGIHELQELLIGIATMATVFDHVGTPVSNNIVKVLETVRRLKQDHKLVRVDHLLAELGKHTLSYDDVTGALHFLSSIGEIMYFGAEHDELLSRYIILSRKWFVSALSCILRNDLKRELTETRRFMNMQCIYSNQQFPENPLIQSLTNGSASSCPLLSSADTNMLWLSMQFMREAVDRSSQLNENSTTASTMFGFLERLLVQSGVFLPLQVSHSIDDSEVYFVPCLMATATENNDVWTFKSSESWMTTLCHSWLFRSVQQSLHC